MGFRCIRVKIYPILWAHELGVKCYNSDRLRFSHFALIRWEKNMNKSSSSNGLNNKSLWHGGNIAHLQEEENSDFKTG